jgi:putative hydrolase of the HAD superfamily
MPIKNIVFDVGNVLVRWDPLLITQTAFPHYGDHIALSQAIFKHPTWFELNAGKITQDEAVLLYHQRLGFPIDSLEVMMVIARESLTPIEGSFGLLKTLQEAQFNLYALTDNTHEFMKYLRATYAFWDVFQGVVVSAEVGHLKPSKEIYQFLLTTYQLQPSQTVFIDDVLINVEGAKANGMAGIQFANHAQCIQALQALDIRF